MSSKATARPLVPPTSWLKSEAPAEKALGPGFLVLITLLAIFLRFYNLTGQSLWVDEVMSWATIRPGIGLNFVEQIRDAIQGPLYLAVTWPLLRLQDSALMLRLPAAVFGSLTVPLFAVTVDRFLGGRTARMAGLFLAISPFHIWYSQEGRGYGLLMFFAVAMGFLIFRMTTRGISPGSAVLFALCSAGAVWSNMSGLFLWAAMGLGVLTLDRPRTRRQWGLWLLAFGGGLVAVLPWLLKAAGIWAVDRVIVGNATGEALRGETTFTPLALPYSVFTFIYGYSLGPSLRQLHHVDKLAVLKPALPVLAAAALPVGVGLVAGLAGLRRRSWTLLIWIVVPVLILTFLAQRNVKPWNPRYIAVVFPWLLALLAHGLIRLPRHLGGVLSLLLIGLTLFSLSGYYWSGRYAKADVRALAAEVVLAEEGSGGPADPILVPAVANVFKYYYQGAGEVISTFEHAPLKDSAEAGVWLEEVLAGKDRLFFVQAREWYFDPQGTLPTALTRRGHLRLVRQVPGAKLYFWEAPATGQAADEH